MPSNAYYIPCGPDNLASLFPAVDFSKVREYFIQVLDSATTIIASTPLNVMVNPCENDLRIHYVNLAGAVDSFTVTLTNIEHATKADAYQATITNPLVKSVHAINRINLKANNTYRVQLIVQEDNMEMVQELLDTPYAWIEWPGTQGQGPDYLPIVLLDQKTPIRKPEERYEYPLDIDFILSHERMTIRG